MASAVDFVADTSTSESDDDVPDHQISGLTAMIHQISPEYRQLCIDEACFVLFFSCSLLV